MALARAKEIVSSHAVVVFSKSSCPYCIQVKKLLLELGATFESDGGETQSALAQWNAHQTVPNVLIGGNYIGGCDSTTGMHKAGKLVPLLTEAGAITSSSSS
ncbi:hypothetical protein MKX01_029774 [Papaver californicum]|nr:hypothetical protein MKX01_029774 [Papaver californicum]